MSEVPDVPPGPEKDPREVPLDQWAATRAQAAIAGKAEHDDNHHTPGTFVLTLIFLASFAIYYFANWKALADVWHVR